MGPILSQIYLLLKMHSFVVLRPFRSAGNPFRQRKSTTFRRGTILIVPSSWRETRQIPPKNGFHLSILYYTSILSSFTSSGKDIFKEND